MTKWISVEDKLPEEQGSYLVFFKVRKGNAIAIMYYDNHVKFGITKVSHWMNLPKPPKDE